MQLNRPRTEGLPTILFMMKPAAVPALCTLLGNLEQPTHQTLVVNALTELAKDTPDIVAKHLTDRRPAFVRNLLAIITRWKNPRLADHVEKILRYPDPLIRREVIRTLATLRPNGTATKLIHMLNDSDEGVRLAPSNPCSRATIQLLFRTGSLLSMPTHLVTARRQNDGTSFTRCAQRPVMMRSLTGPTC